MSVYSPSQTDVFKECPLAWWFRYQQKYVSRTYNQKEIAGAVGSAFSTYQEHIDGGHEQAKELAVADLNRMLNELRDTRELSERAASFEQSSNERLHRFIALFQKKNPIPSSWEMFDREKVFPDHGNCRVDAMYRTSMGQLGVLDFKTRGRLQANQVDKARREFGTSNQLYHYCWAASEVYGEEVNQFSIVMLSLEPRAFCEIWQYRIKPGFLAVWEAGRKQDWEDMTAIKEGKRTPSPATVHENKFGQCTYYDACFRHGLVEEHINQDFIIR